MGTFRVISKEVKDQIIDRVKNQGISVSQAAQDAGISTKTIYNWLSQKAVGQPGLIEVAKLKRENKGLYELVGKLTSELEIQKKRAR
jgi:transposase-like protein